MTERMRSRGASLRRLSAAVVLLAALNAATATNALADSAGSQRVESSISDWSYDPYFLTVEYQYDQSGRLIEETTQCYADEQHTMLSYESADHYDYYDNGALRMIQSHGAEKHFDRYGTQIDSPKPAAPFEVCTVWYEDKIEHYYDLKGNLTRLEADQTVYTYRYDESGRILEVQSTEPFDYHLTFTYGKDGGYTVHGERNPYDSGEEKYQEEYDRSGRIVRRSSDQYGVTETTHEYSSDGSVETIKEYRDEGSGLALSETREIRKIHDDSGLLLREETWVIDNGMEELAERKDYEYDGRGNMTHMQRFEYSGWGSAPSLWREERHTYR
ncbi:MAG: hypothetical protein IJV30_04745 [Oscillospiraceae bacterium]|nr:hypothetical protein [Oscillospiraceae bacterium]